MKKFLLYVICLFSMLFVAGQKSNKTKPKAKTTSDDLYDYLHITDRKVISEKKYPFKSFDPQNKAEFREYNKEFNDKYLNPSSPLLTNSNSFYLNIYSMFSMMQNDFGIQTSRESPTGNFNGVRIYPALSPKNVLYLVFVGEKIAPTNPLTFFPMRDLAFYQIKENLFSTLQPGSGEKENAEKDILHFIEFWKTNEPSSKFDSSYCFSISAYHFMLDSKRLDILKDQKDENTKSGIIFYPCIHKKEKRHLFFVVKGVKTIVNTQRQNQPFILEDKNFYNHTDECPEKCPSDNI